MRFSANLGFLFTDRPLLEAIHLARETGFDAVELHWPYDTPAHALRGALGDLPLVSLNTVRGDLAQGEFGLAALPGREDAARRSIDEALAYAAECGAENLHVMAGRAKGEAALAAFLGNLAYAVERAEPQGIRILIEPLNAFDAPGYFLDGLTLAERVAAAIASPALRIMFDCYHMARMGEDVEEAARRTMPRIGHIQFAGVPDRGEPDRGTLDYSHLLPALRAAGYEGVFGAEYRPQGGNFDWLERFRRLA